MRDPNLQVTTLRIHNTRRRNARRTHKKKLLEKHNFKCVYCQTSDKLTVDHVIPLSRGGSNKLENLQICCLRCNVSKFTRTHEEYLRDLVDGHV